MLLSVLFCFLPPAFLLSGLRHWIYAAHIVLLCAASWYRFPSLEYDLWHPYYIHYLGLVHLTSINLLTLFAYGWDKRQATCGGWRIPEKTLHALAFIGGTPGAWLGSKLFRHKTIKGQFRQMFLAVFILQIIVIIGAIWISKI